MKLKKLEITGFKSFNEKSTIHFPEGISAIVGPNGCGKSNVVDAIRWVMGEQSAKRLRGKSMEDIIFSGTNGQQPLNLAEVSLTLLNDNGSAPEELKDFTEIMLTRRVYRSGERAYFINKQPCRLKDIYNIFYGSGMGPKSYAVIEQGNIGAITDADPVERRYFIEEAAGITRYKNRKTDALRKVESTNRNLTRLRDILVEIKRQMTGLQRQAKKAERFKKYQDRIRTLDALHAIATHEEMTARIDQSAALLESLRDEDTAHSARLKSIDAAIEHIRLEKERKNEEIASRKSGLFEKRRTADRIENDLAHHRQAVENLTDEIAGLESIQQDLEEKHRQIVAEMEQVRQENADLRKERESAGAALAVKRSAAEEVSGRLDALKKRQEAGKSELMELVAQEARLKNIYQNASSSKESVQRRLKRILEEELVAGKKIAELEGAESAARQELASIRDDIGGMRTAIDETKSSLAEKSARLADRVKQVQSLEIERNKTRSRYSALKKMEENFEWYRDGVKAIMRRSGEPAADGGPAAPDAAAVHGLLADVIEPEPALETAVDAVLGESLQYILVRDQRTGSEAIAYLQAREAGRSGFIPLAAVKSARPPAAGDGRPAADRLLDHVGVKPGYERVAEALLGHVFLAADLPEALEMFHRNGAARTIVTPAGEVLSEQGVMIGGSRDKLSGILAKKKEVRELEGQLAGLDGDIETARRRQEALETDLRDIERRLQKAIAEKNGAEREEIDTEKALYRVSEDLRHERRRHEIVSLEVEQLQGEASDLDEKMSRYDTAVSDIEGRIRQLQRGTTEITEKIEAIASRAEAVNRETVDLKLKLTSVDARLENSNHTLKRLETYRNDTQERYRRTSGEITLKTEKISATENRIAEDGERLSRLYAAVEAMELSLESAETDFRSIDTQLKESDSAIADIQDKREALLKKIRVLELDLSEEKMRRENVEKRLEERYGMSLTRFRVEFRNRSEEIAADLEKEIGEIEEELAACREKISKISDVNLGAIKEYDELKERFDFLTAQQDDLVKAVDDLHRVIRKINRITQEKFSATFDLINEKLDEVFPKLFEGGSAKLVLTEPNNLLESGVEFMIHPPGKKLTRLSLLSGGEKALSAIAFIFSIFLIKPASFCLLDEIDAPLDDVNVSRFNALLQLIGKQSQVVMITHNKRSMEFADTLFGITMEKKGISKVVSVDLTKQAA